MALHESESTDSIGLSSKKTMIVINPVFECCTSIDALVPSSKDDCSLVPLDNGKEVSDVDQIIESRGLKQITDSAALEALIDSVLQANTKSVEEFRAGKEKAFNALVGQVMKASQGKANPQQLNELLRQKLQSS